VKGSKQMIRRGRAKLPRLSVLAMLTGVFALLAASPATASTSPSLSLTSLAAPTHFAPGSTGDQYEISVQNGVFATNGSEIVVADTLPAGLTATAISGSETKSEAELSCNVATLTCTFGGVLPAGDTLLVVVTVSVAPGTRESVTNMATVSGGGANSLSVSDPTIVSSVPAAPGIQVFDASASNQDGSPATQAGGHPYQLTTSFSVNTVVDSHGVILPAGGDIKDIQVDLPAGFIGDPTATSKCTEEQLTFETGACPPSSQVGVVTLVVPLQESMKTFPAPVYNMVPPPGVPAQFAFTIVTDPVHINASVRSDGDYGVTASISNAAQALGVISSSLTLWGVPADPSHDAQRKESGVLYGNSLPTPSNFPPKPFLTNPMDCSAGPLTTTLQVDPWPNPEAKTEASFVLHDNFGNSIGVTGCEGLAFLPAIAVQPDTTRAASPAALEVELKVPQNPNTVGLATPPLKKAVVTLPQGMVVNPSAAEGLGGCSAAQIAIGSLAEPTCPGNSKIGSVTVTTPLLEAPLTGSVYVAAPTPSQLLGVYLVVHGNGVLVKLAGTVNPDPNTGQLTATFDNNPQLPFEDLKMSFKGGPRAPLVNPVACGVATTTTQLTPYGGALATPMDSFNVSQDGNGAACPSPQPFSPTLSAGTTSPQGGSFSPFTLTLSRTDQDQNLGQVSVRTPPGLLAMLSRVMLCGEPQAQQGTCPATSQIGHVSVGAGAGPNPLYVPQLGKPQAPVFLTGPYRGAPFGLSIPVPAQAGPFDLGTVTTRAALYIDQHTAQATIVSDPLPRILKGIPLNIRTVNVIVDREGFIFNPTNCEPLSVTGTIISTVGASANVSSRFQAANCATLPFHPKFTVSTQAYTSKKNGASLDVKVTSGPGQANIGKTVVSLPKQLPSRLTTLQQACPGATFAANPATCPAGSNVGTAKAMTPVLNEPLSGPAYLVSHGGAAFPDLVVVLQGQGIRLDLVGGTGIKKGITTSSFNSVPDAPITSFEVKLPQGSHSALTAALPAKAKGSLCATKLTMPTTLTGQNGAQIKQSTKVAVSGCPKVRARKSRRANGNGGKK
jgi:hypothetical protein